MSVSILKDEIAWLRAFMPWQPEVPVVPELGETFVSWRARVTLTEGEVKDGTDAGRQTEAEAGRDI